MTEIWVLEVHENPARNRRAVIEWLEERLLGVHGVYVEVKAVAVVSKDGISFIRKEEW